MSNNKKKKILGIISECIEEFIEYLFVIFDKTIITYFIDKTNN